MWKCLKFFIACCVLKWYFENFICISSLLTDWPAKIDSDCGFSQLCMNTFTYNSWQPRKTIDVKINLARTAKIIWFYYFPDKSDNGRPHHSLNHHIYVWRKREKKKTESVDFKNSKIRAVLNSSINQIGLLWMWDLRFKCEIHTNINAISILFEMFNVF